MIEEKALAVKWCNEILENDSDFTLSAISYQYILWTRSKTYETQSFDWVTLNAHLRSSLDNCSFTEQFMDVMQNVQSFTDVQKLIKIEDELRDFQQYTKIVPFKKLTQVRG